MTRPIECFKSLNACQRSVIGYAGDMTDLASLHAAAFKTELAASRRLMARAGIDEAEALRRTLTLSAGVAGLEQLLAERSARRQHAELQAARRQAGADAARLRGTATANSAWRAWFDGSARPNPGRCGLGGVLTGPGGQRVELSFDGGYGNSSEAEYLALNAVLRAAVEHGARGLVIHGDSQVVIDDVNAPECAGAPALRAYRDQARALLAKLPGATLRWIPRHKNLEADALSQRAVPNPALPEPSEQEIP
jgi:ribonuclease HI